MLCLKGLSYLEMYCMQIFLVPDPVSVAEIRPAWSLKAEVFGMRRLQSL